jgi:protein-tyrosine phosphatase
MGNVCRSPTAEAVFRHRLVDAGLSGIVECASAGTHDFNLGRQPDGRARAAAAQRGYDMSKLRGRQVAEEDFTRFNLILAMDRDNLGGLESRCPEDYRARVRLLMEFARRHNVLEIPDPYYSNARGFELVLDMIEDACDGLLHHVQTTLAHGSNENTPSR